MLNPSIFFNSSAKRDNMSRRIEMEIAQLKKEEDWVVVVDENDPRSFRITVPAPEETPYHGYKLIFLFQLGSSYPFKPPVVSIISPKVFHPNIDFSTGAICVSFLKGSCEDGWSPAMDINGTIRSLLLSKYVDVSN